MRWPWQDRFEGVIIGYRTDDTGQETAEVTALPFIRFRHQVQAQRWADTANADRRSQATRYDYRPLPAAPDAAP